MGHYYGAHCDKPGLKFKCKDINLIGQRSHDICQITISTHMALGLRIVPVLSHDLLNGHLLTKNLYHSVNCKDDGGGERERGVTLERT